MSNEGRLSINGRFLINAACLVIILAGLQAARSIVVTFLLSAFMAVVCSAPLYWLRRRGLPMFVSVLVVIAGIVIAALMMTTLIGSSINDFSNNLPTYQDRLHTQWKSLSAWLESIGVDTAGLVDVEIFEPQSLMPYIGRVLSEFGSMLTNGFVITLIVIFLLLEASTMPNKLRAILEEPNVTLPRFSEASEGIKSYLGIKTWVSMGTGIMVTVWLAILGIDYPLLWGVLAFFLNYVPNIGSIIAAVPGVIMALIQFGFAKAGWTAAGYIVINILVGSVLEPRFMGKGLGLSTLVVFLSLIFWGWVLGPVGMLLSVPLTMVMKIALENFESTRWLAILLSSNVPPPAEPDDEEESAAD